ncbi:MAG TPA: GNAT family N-acetyltransferase [Rhizomicrobium sp.]|nr:GNAT family N-acetyltransferase [Rhizomicrobium sp.]
MLRDATKSDFPAILALNAESVHFLSPLDDARLAALAKAACYFRVVEDGGAVAAFLLGFRKGAGYDSPNFLWFDARFDDFVYVDRVVVSAEFRGRKLADRLYDDLESFARANGVDRVTCEVNVEPPNPVSLKFHARRGFREIGQIPYGPGKTVALLQCDLA